MTISPNPYRGFRFLPEVIQHFIWLYHCFSLSLRDVELILAARGIEKPGHPDRRACRAKAMRPDRGR
jgi:transposase-like protein